MRGGLNARKCFALPERQRVEMDCPHGFRQLGGIVFTRHVGGRTTGLPAARHQGRATIPRLGLEVRDMGTCRSRA
jgi:hypothetical protein